MGKSVAPGRGAIHIERLLLIRHKGTIGQNDARKSNLQSKKPGSKSGFSKLGKVSRMRTLELHFDRSRQGSHDIVAECIAHTIARVAASEFG